MRTWMSDTLMAVVVAAVSVAFTMHDAVASLLAVVLSAALAVRRTHPALALAVATAAAVAHAVLLTALPVAVVVVPILVFSLARWSSRTLAWTALGIGLAGSVAGPARWLVEPVSAKDLLTTVAAYAGVVVVAFVAGLRERERVEARERAAEVAAAEERNEIAREVHDVVAHSLSMIAVQAEGGRAAPERAGEVLAVIADESRKALNEVRDMVGVMRRGGYRPAPGLGDLPELVGRVGDRATLHMGRESIGPVLGLTVYRVVQESLTNFLRHAGPGARVEVTVVTGDGVVDVTVRDDGRGAAALSDGRGHGVIAMRERVESHGGTVTTSATAEGFEVHAVLPLRGES